MPDRLAFVDLPVTFAVESHFQQPIFGIMVLAAAGTDHVAAPCRSLAVVVFGNGESHAATAWDEEHAEGSLWLGPGSGFGSGFQDSHFPIFQDRPV